VTDNFFDRGGHSLRIAKSISLIERRLGVTVPLAEFFTYPTVRALAAYIIDRSKFGVASADHALVPLSANGDGPSLFAFPPGTGDALGFAQLAALLPCRFYGFNFIEADTRLSDYADLIIGTDPDGPYLLLGYSSGGNLAYHVARELEQRGRRVAGIVMVDSTRRLHPTPMPDQEVERVTREFLNDESMKPYLASPILRDKAQRLVGSSLRYAANSVDYHTIDTDIHVLTSENPAAEYRDASGKLVVSQSAWTDVIRGELKVYRGDGSHNTMLGHPHLARNAAAIADILTWMRRGDAMRRRTDAEHQAPTVA
jgi:hybrid polyketide synthase/nonribosomal peptide synthetase FtdB